MSISPGFLDLHLLHAAKAGWEAYTATEAAFLEFFPLHGDEAKKWYAEVTDPKGVPAFRVESAKGLNYFPLVLSKLTGEGSAETALGEYVGTTDDGRELWGFNVRQTADLTVITRNPMLTRAMAVVLRGALVVYHKQFLADGYNNFDYDGMDGLTADAMAFGDEMGLYYRRMRFSASTLVYAPAAPAGTPVESKPWYVQAADITTTPPGVVPASGCGTPGGVTID